MSHTCLVRVPPDFYLLPPATPPCRSVAETQTSELARGQACKVLVRLLIFPASSLSLLVS